MKFFCKLMVVVLSVTTSILSTVDAAAPIPCVDKDACFNCQTKGKCDKPNKVIVADAACAATEACTVLGAAPSTPVCRPIAQTTCNCTGKMKGCDPFDLTQPIFCITGSLYPGVACTVGKKLKCSAGDCIDPANVSPSTDPAAVCKDATNSYKIVTPACKIGVFCAGNVAVSTTTCKDTEYFDLPNTACAPFPPPNPCVGCGKTKCAVITTGCSKYAVCDGETFLDEETCPAATPKFNFDAQKCAATAAGPCSPFVGCTFPVPTHREQFSYNN